MVQRNLNIRCFRPGETDICGRPSMAMLYTSFAFIAIVVSCLGLFGISLFDIRQRYREIAIRKVNGAMLKDLYVLLLRRYVGMLLLAAVVAVPLAWLAIHYYTADLVVKAPVTVGLFLAAFLIVAVISVATLLWQVNKASRINPSEVMKVNNKKTNLYEHTTLCITFPASCTTYTLINLLGLAFSLACCIILLRYIHRELTVDTHCVDREMCMCLVVRLARTTHWFLPH